MARLIDEDKIQGFMNEHNVSDAFFADVVQLIAYQPTAYDLDKVVERITEISNMFVAERNYEGHCKSRRDNCRNRNCFACVLDRVIEVVKAGGLDG